MAVSIVAVESIDIIKSTRDKILVFSSNIKIDLLFLFNYEDLEKKESRYIVSPLQRNVFESN